MARKKKRDREWEEPEMFADAPIERPPAKHHKEVLIDALWTGSKALLVRWYLYLFVQITKSGTYVDGFAGPQYPDVPDSWAARMVIESEPDWLDHFHLFELEKPKAVLLEHLAAEHPDRDVHVYQGDFNERVKEILAPEVIAANQPTFCLIDQQTFECAWSTVEQIAAYKDPLKIELFYFLANEWLGRAVAATTTDDGRKRIERWWGGGLGWEALRALTPMQRADSFTRRFTQELGYRWATPYVIYKKEGGVGIAYWMIHATDHPDAPALMDRAYAKAVIPKRDGDQLTMV